MAQAMGYSCDQCGKFEVASGDRERKLPKNWMTLTVPTEMDRAANSFDLCSNKCVRLLASAREKAERELGEGDSVTNRSLYANHVRHHLNEGKVNPDCEFCVAMTDPARAAS